MRNYSSLLLVLILLIGVSSCSNKSYVKNNGPVFGTFYSITYQSEQGANYEDEILQLLGEFNASLSTYDKNSIISRVNQDKDSVILDDYFINCFEKSQEISYITNGAFDLTVAPVVNAWGFGFKNYDNVDSLLIDSLMQYVGYQKVSIQNQFVKKQHQGIKLDASAVAKGYAVDVVANYLANKGIKNYLVEIGGEINAAGVNAKGKTWRVGIDKPIESINASNRELQAIVSLKNKSLATSGNYRQFYEKDGIKYSHTIDPKTGYPTRHSLLSVSVLADDCLTADAYATAFMVMGLENTKKLAAELENIEVFLIYSDSTKQYKTFQSQDFTITEVNP